ncbi:MAG TPA: permease-like cell division protein FtsX [Actinomycetaceae bacterium]|nr:permease-like cell division protein FtsX [Actinomycetaceae bacterium]
MRWQFVLSQTFSGLRRNMSMAVAVALVTFISLLFVGLAGLLQFQVNKMRTYLYDQVQVAAFMCPDRSTVPNCAAGEVTQEQLDGVQELLASSDLAGYVESVITETPQEAYDNLRRITDAPWVERVEPEDMQYVFRISLHDPEQYEIIADELRGVAGVERVIDQRDVLEPLFELLNKTTGLALGLGLVMVVAAVLLITTTIRLSAMSRRRETSIMRLVGASNAFIQLPFVLEGVTSALVGAGLAIAALWAGVRYVIQGWFGGGENSLVNFIDTTDVWIISPFLILAALLLSILSSLITLGRYTKV